MKYDQELLFPAISHGWGQRMARLYVAPHLRALFREWCWFSASVDWRDRTCHRSLAVGKLCELAAGTARAIQGKSRLAERIWASG